MTQLTLTLSNYLQSPIEGLFDLINQMIRDYQEAKKVRATIKELSKLSDRELNDIGIARGDIYAIAHESEDYARFADANTNLKGWV